MWNDLTGGLTGGSRAGGDVHLDEIRPGGVLPRTALADRMVWRDHRGPILPLRPLQAIAAHRRGGSDAVL